MARKEAIFKLEVDSGEAVKDIKKLDQDMTHLAETIGIEVSGSISAMEDKLYELALTGQQNTKEFKELQAQVAKYKQVIIETDRSIDQLAEQGRGLSSALSIAESTVAGFQAYTGVTALLGSENEELLETITKLEAAQGVLNSIEVVKQQLQANAIKLTQAQTFAQNLLTKALGKGSIASKIFRGALLATGVGALVVGIGLLISNFEKVTEWVKRAKKSFEDSGVVIKTLLFPITILIDAYNKVVEVLQYMGVIESEESKARKKRIEDNISNIEKERNAVGDRYDFEIEKAKASGKNTFELETQKRKAVIESVKAQIKEILKLAILNKEITEEQKKAIEELKNEANKAQREQTLAEITEQTKRKEEAKKTNEEANKRRAEELKAIQEQARLVIAMRNELLDEISRIEDEQFFNEREKAINAVNEKYFDLIERTKQLEGDYTAELKILRDAQQAELKKLDDQFLEEDLAKKKEQNDRLRAFEKELEDLNFEIRREDLKTNLEQLEQLEIDALKSKYERTIEEILANEQLTEDQKLELIKANKLREEQEIELIQEEFRARRKEADELEAKEKEERFNNYISGLQSGLTSISDLTNTLLDIQIENSEKGSAKELALQKKKFEINKKLQIAQAVMQGIQAVQAAYASGVATPIVGPATGAIFAGIAGVQALANIAKIKAQKFEGGTGSIGGGGGGSSAGLSASNLSIGTGDDLSSNQTFLNADGTQQGGTTKVVVLESDISNKQDTVKQIETKSTF